MASASSLGGHDHLPADELRSSPAVMASASSIRLVTWRVRNEVAILARRYGERQHGTAPATDSSDGLRSSPAVMASASRGQLLADLLPGLVAILARRYGERQALVHPQLDAPAGG